MTKEQINYYIVKQSNGTLWAFYYDEDDGICCMTHTHDAWSKKQIVYSNGTKNFSVYLDHQDNIYLFCQDVSGNIILYQYSSKGWESQVLLYSKNGFIDSLYFDTVIQGEDIYLFYNLKDPNSNRHALVQQIAISGKQWNNPSLVDYIYPINKNPFSVYQNTKNDIYLYYQKKKEDYLLGYKKYSHSIKAWRDFYCFDSGHFSYIDESTLINNNDIFNLYIKKEKYYSILFFKAKNEEIWKEPKKIFEKNDISSCSLFMIDDHLWITWICNDKLYSCYSTDMGDTFSEASIHLIDSPTAPTKANYQSNYLQEQKRLSANEIYINTNNQIEFLIIPEVFPAIKGNSIQIEETFIPPTEKVDNYLNEIKLHLNQVYEEIYICKKQLREKDNQIAQLKYSLKHKNKDIAKSTYELRKNNEIQKKELLSLKEKNKNLEESIHHKNLEIQQLEEKIIAQRKGMSILKQELETRKAPLIITAEENKIIKNNKTSIIKKLFNFEE